MSAPALWLTFAALFVLAGVLNLARALRGREDLRPARIALAASCLAWAAAGPAFRFVGRAPAYVAVGCGVAIMLLAAVLSLRRTA